jgi:pyruvate ferredoxin oxidoreductase alpha subunit
MSAGTEKIPSGNPAPGTGGQSSEGALKASEFLHLSSINEAPSQVLGDHLITLETYKDFSDKGTVVLGGNAAERNWTDKNFVPVTLATQCIDCMHCVVACPHHSIGYEVADREVSGVLRLFQQAANLIPGVHLDDRANHSAVSKGRTSYSHCKGCFVCASACPTGAIHFVPAELVDMQGFDGRKVGPAEIGKVFKAPSGDGEAWVDALVRESGKLLDAQAALAAAATTAAGSASSGAAPAGLAEPAGRDARVRRVFSGSAMFADFVFQARFDSVSIFPITPNTTLLKFVEERADNQPADAPHRVQFRPCLSEESGYAWLTGAAVRGKRCFMAQGSQSLAQIYEFMNINPGLHLPVFMLELTRALSPGTTTKPDHTTTYRTSDTGEVILFGRGLQDDYDKAFLLLKIMESEGVWISGRLVVKGFVETHTLTSEKQGRLEKLTAEEADAYLGRPRNPFVFADGEDRSIGVLDMDSRYAEQRQAIDDVLARAGDAFDKAAGDLSLFTGRKPIRKVARFPEEGKMDFCVVGLNDPDMSTAEYVAGTLGERGIRAGVASINLYRPFPSHELREAVKGCRAVCVAEYNNWSGHGGGGTLAQEVRSALYGMEAPPRVIAVQMGLGGRAVTIPHWVTLFRMLADLASGPENTRTHAWLREHAPDDTFVLGTRGNPAPRSDADFDLPLTEAGVKQYGVVGKGGQGLLQLNSLFTGLATLRDQFALSMAGFGALQRGGGITLGIKMSDRPIRDWSDIIMADTVMAFDGDVSLEPMLRQLRPGGTLILDGGREMEERFGSLMPPGARMVLVPAKRISRRVFGDSARTNMILFGAMAADMGIRSESELLNLLDRLPEVQGIDKEARLVLDGKNRQALLAGFKAYREASARARGGPDATSRAADWSPVEGASGAKASPAEPAAATSVETLDRFQDRILPPHLKRSLDKPGRLRFWERLYALKKLLYQVMFHFHPTVNKIRSMYIAQHRHGHKPPLTAGDMACAGCGQINIFRTVFNYLDYLQRDRGKIYVSEQDGCGTVMTGLNRTSIWNLSYIRIAFETAHGVASGLAHNVGKDDMVVSISGDGGFIQGLRSVEDALHQQDPILHIVVINQTLGNTGGQATATTMQGAQTREGHVARREPTNFLKIAEKFSVQGAMASTVHLADLYRKIGWAHDVVTRQKKPFMLLMHFSCLEQGMNLARSLGAQKMALNAHFFNLYSLRYKEVKDGEGRTLYLQKRLTIDYFPWVFGKRQWKQRLKSFYGIQKMMHHLAHDEEALERNYWLLRGEWNHLAQEMGWWRFHFAFLRSLFSIHRITMWRLIKWGIPKEAGR